MIILYHSIIPNESPAERWCVGQALTQTVFERHIRWLVKHHKIVSLAEYLSVKQKQGSNKDKLIALTFDDGFSLTFKCVLPLLEELNIPATFFIATGHLGSGELLWFSYLKALCFEQWYKSIVVKSSVFPLQTIAQRKRAWNELSSLAKASKHPANYCKMLSERYPLPRGLSAIYDGMTHSQLKLAGNSHIIELGAHTKTHPYLDQISRKEQEKEILDGKLYLSKLTGNTIRYFAYPGGAYNKDSVELVKSCGYEAAFAVIPKKIGSNSLYEIGRIGIYSNSLLILIMKTLGLATLGRQLGIRIG